MSGMCDQQRLRQNATLFEITCYCSDVVTTHVSIYICYFNKRPGSTLTDGWLVV